MRQKSSVPKEIRIPKKLLNPLCNWLIDNFSEGETVLMRNGGETIYFRIVAANDKNTIAFKMHVDIDYIKKVKS